MRYFLDTEFVDHSQTIDLISIGIVADDGREFYAQSADATYYNISEWMREKVMPRLQLCPYQSNADAISQKATHANLLSLQKVNHAMAEDARCGPECPWLPLSGLAREMRAFCDPDEFGRPEFWGYYSAYDWVAVCQTFGSWMDRPQRWPGYCNDLKQWARMLGDPTLPTEGKDQHHALLDARWARNAYYWLHAYTAAQAHP